MLCQSCHRFPCACVTNVNTSSGTTYTPCANGNHVWTYGGAPDMNLEGMLCDCRLTTYHTEECPHCHTMISKPIPIPAVAYQSLDFAHPFTHTAGTPLLTGTSIATVTDNKKTFPRPLEHYQP